MQVFWPAPAIANGDVFFFSFSPSLTRSGGQMDTCVGRVFYRHWVLPVRVGTSVIDRAGTSSHLFMYFATRQNARVFFFSFVSFFWGPFDFQRNVLRLLLWVPRVSFFFPLITLWRTSRSLRATIRSLAVNWDLRLIVNVWICCFLGLPIMITWNICNKFTTPFE